VTGRSIELLEAKTVVKLDNVRLAAIWTDGKKLFTSQKPAGGAWSKPREIFNEERGVHHIGAPARSAENFVPFVWSIRGKNSGARFVRIPVNPPGE
jgi:hypothetical protein